MTPEDDATTSPAAASSSNELLPTSVTSGRYLLGEEIARGGMGVVLSARDTILGRTVAVKALLERFAGEPELVARFLEEARVTGQLQHPGIPPVHDLGSLSDGRPFMAMKLIKGRTLAELLKEHQTSGGAVDAPELIAIFERVCQTVAFAHDRNVVHRDIKPANIMVGAFGEVQVMDWGLTKVLNAPELAQPFSVVETPLVSSINPGRDPDSATEAGSVVGTWAYMSPEQARGELDRIGTWSDVFSLGALLCELLTGKPPYTGSRAVLRAHAELAILDESFARLDGSGADAGIVEWCKRCLARVPEERPRHAGLLAEGIADHRRQVEHRLRSAEQAQAVAEARAIEEANTRREAESRIAEQRKKRRVQAALAGTLGLLLLAAISFGWWRDHQNESVRRREAAIEAERVLAAAQNREGIKDTLRIAGALRKQYRFREAAETLDHASRLAAGNGSEDLLSIVRQAQEDLAFVNELDGIHMKRTIWISVPGKPGHYDDQSAPASYRDAFRTHGFDVVECESATMVARITASEVKPDLIAALDDWAVLEPDATIRTKVLELARLADPGPWSDRFRTAANWEDNAALDQLAADAVPAELSPHLLVSFADLLKRKKRDPERVLLAAQFAHPNDFLIAFTLGDWFMAWEKQHDHPDVHQAITFFRIALALRKNHYTAILNLGDALSDIQELDESIACLKEAVRRDPNASVGFNHLSEALIDRGDYDEALAMAREAVRVDPHKPECRFFLVHALAKKGLKREGLIECNEAIRLGCTSTQSRLFHASSLAILGERDAALAAYREAIRLDPTSTDARIELGFFLIAADDLDGAEAEFQHALRIDPQSPMAHLSIGELHYRDRDFDGVMAEVRTAMAIRPDSTFAHSLFAWSLEDKGELDAAIIVWRMSHTISPKDAEILRSLAIALLKKNDRTGAKLASREAVRLQPKNSACQITYGDVLEALGELDDALTAFETASRLDPILSEAEQEIIRLRILITGRNALIAALPDVKR